MELSSHSPSTSLTQGLQARGNNIGKVVDDLWSYMRGDDLLYPDHKFTEAQPNPNSGLSIHPLADPNFDWNYWANAEDPPPRPVALKEVGQASGYAPSPPLAEPEHQVVSPSSQLSSLGLPKEPEDHVVPGPDHQSLSADSQWDDRQAAIYAAKGKAKVTRRISGTAGDVGNAAQRELQPAERSLDPGQ